MTENKNTINANTSQKAENLEANFVGEAENINNKFAVQFLSSIYQNKVVIGLVLLLILLTIFSINSYLYTLKLEETIKAKKEEQTDFSNVNDLLTKENFVNDLDRNQQDVSDLNIYENNLLKFYYPSSYIFVEDERGEIHLNGRINWGVSDQSLVDCRGDCYIVTSSQDVEVNGIKSKRLEGWIGDMFGIPQSFIVYEIPFQGKLLTFYLWELDYDAQTSDFINENGDYAGRNPGNIPKDEISEFEKIVSSISFINR